MSKTKNHSIDFARQYQEKMPDSREEKNDYLAVAARSVSAYLKTGMRDSALKEFKENEEKFRSNYSATIDLQGACNHNMQKAFYGAIEAAQKDAVEEVQVLSVQISVREMKQREEYAELLSRSLKNQWNNLHAHLKAAFEEIAYMGRIQELYELYEQENENRNAEHQFEADLEKYKGLASIVLFLEESKRSQIDTICKETGLEMESVKNILRHCSTYFSRKKFRGIWTVVLNVNGRKLSRYLHIVPNAIKNEDLYSLFDNALDKWKIVLNNGRRKDFVTPVFDTDYLTSTQKKILNRKFDEIVCNSLYMEETLLGEYEVIDNVKRLDLRDKLDFREEEENERKTIRFTI